MRNAQSPWYWLWIPPALLLLAAPGVWWLVSDSAHQKTDVIETFLTQHWQHPLPPQGTPPAHFSDIEASLSPSACGQCHTAQYADWRKSLHSQSMTAGVLWQFRLMDQAQANQCMDCHAPLAEQRALIAQEHHWPAAPAGAPPSHVPADLGHQGLTCAGCHVRGHQRFGPPPRADQAAVQHDRPHDGVTLSGGFQDSRFCATCHQFPEDGPRTAGKLREDTWAQWNASEFAQRGEQCQSCHMPDRKHQWQGVHSPDMIRKALDVSFEVRDNTVTATLTNTGAGHYFPTYMVPKINAHMLLVSGDQELTTLAHDVIGWHVDIDLETEFFDTRIPPGQAHRIDATLPATLPDNATVELRVEVVPREHYERTYESVLAQAALLDPETLGLLQRAYDEAVAARFEAFRVSTPLPSSTLSTSTLFPSILLPSTEVTD